MPHFLFPRQWSRLLTAIAVATLVLMLVYGYQILSTRSTNYTSGTIHKKQNHNSTHKPLFFMQAGPSHMATSRLVDTLTEYKTLLFNDSLVFDPELIRRPLLGTYCRKDVGCCGQDCVLNSYNLSDLNDLECMQELQQNLLTEQELHHNVLMATELIGNVQANYNGKARCTTHWNIWQYLFQNWQVEIIVGYRRYYEWLVSLKIAADEPFKYRNYQDWPPKGTVIVPIWHHLMSILNQTMNFATPYTTEVVRDFKPYYNVSIWNLHDEGDSLAWFLCNKLPNTQQACDAYLKKSNSTKSLPTKLPASTHAKTFYDLIAVAAHDAGLVNHTLTRPFVVEQIKHRHEDVLGLKPMNFPLDCPSKQELEQQLLAKSLEYEQWLLVEFYKSSRGEQQHVKEFWEMADRHEFCTVNVNYVLHNDTAWRSFLQSLGN